MAEHSEDIVALPGGPFAPGITSTGAVYQFRRPNQRLCDHKWIWSRESGARTLCFHCGARRVAAGSSEDQS